MTPRTALLALLLARGAVACDPFHTGFEAIEDAKYYWGQGDSERAESPAALRVMSYNVKFGGGRIDFFFDCFGDRVLMTEGEVQSHLGRLANKIRHVDPDVLVIQEVDVNSKRTAYVDQMQWLVDHTPLKYGVYASQWKADYVPSDGIGAVDSGNGILSKYPLRDALRSALPERTDQSSLERYFYLKRNLLEARVDLGDGASLWVIGVHAEAYAKDGTKKRHIDRFKEALDRKAGDAELVLGAGDLNTLPPGSERQHDFPDSVCTNEDFIADDYRAEAEFLEPLYRDYAPAIPLADYRADNARYFTHTTDKNGFWNRKLDYLFTNGAWQPESGLVHQDEAQGGLATMPLSDHAPITAELALEPEPEPE